MTPTTDSGFRRVLASVKRALADMDHAQRRLIEIRTGVRQR